MSSDPQTGTTPPRARSLTDIERGPVRYLLAISALSQSSPDRVTTGELHERLGVTQPSASEMMTRLDNRGLVDYERYQGVTLTDRGEALAREVGWRRCIVSTFFDSELDTTLDDGIAFDIGFVLPKDGILRLRELVGSACLRRCPESNGDSGRCRS